MEANKYIKLYDEAIKHLGLTNGVVYCFLLGLGDYKPSVANIAERCGLSVRTTNRAIAELRERGVISYNTDRGTSNVYKCIIDVPKLHTLKKCQKSTTTSAKMAHSVCQNGTLDSVKMAHSKCQNGTLTSAKMAHYNNNNNNYSNNKGNNKAPESNEILLKTFQDVYQKKFGIEYLPDYRTLTNDTAELVARLLRHKESFRDTRSEEDFFRAFFEGCLMVSDQFDLNKFSLAYICKNYNSFINRIANNGNPTNNNNDIDKYAPPEILRQIADAFRE